MDGLSAASSAFAVVSLAIQIGGGIQKLCDFWTSIQDGPKDINSIIQDLQVVSDIVRDIRLEASNERPHSSALSASIAALNGCSSSMEALQSIIDQLQPGISSPKPTLRKWATFRAVWKGDRLRKFQETLRDTKITLILARQNLIGYGVLNIYLLCDSTVLIFAVIWSWPETKNNSMT